MEHLWCYAAETTDDQTNRQTDIQTDRHHCCLMCRLRRTRTLNKTRVRTFQKMKYNYILSLKQGIKILW